MTKAKPEKLKLHFYYITRTKACDFTLDLTSNISSGLFL